MEKKEIALLEYLMRHPGQALTRTQIIDAAWRYDLEALSNVVDIYIHYLVQNQQTDSGMNEHSEAIYHMTFPKMFSDYALGDKIDQGFSCSLIKTVPGVGYKIEA
jgi:DNA-binding winged helix-turn-helix (wHTH) protein